MPPKKDPFAPNVPWLNKLERQQEEARRRAAEEKARQIAEAQARNTPLWDPNHQPTIKHK